MFDHRSQLFTVVAVFLSLGLGVFIGTVLLGDDVFIREQEQMITVLEAEFEKLRRDNQIKTQELQSTKMALEDLQRFVLATEVYLLSGKLEGRHIVFLCVQDADVPAGVIRAVRTAGATTSTLSADELFSEELEPVLEHVIDLVTGSGQIDGLVLVFGDNTPKKIIDERYFPLVSRIAGSGIPVVCGETRNASSPLSLFAGHVSLVDHMDTIFGEISTVYGLLGMKGHYGSKQGASMLFPEIGSVSK
ncbi:MAG: copper transporter [Bacillota bacterium]